MKRTFPAFLLAIFLIFTSAACLAPAIRSKDPSNDVIFQDDFSNTSAGWANAEDPDGATRYENGAYQIRVDTKGFYLWSNPEEIPDMTDVRIEVEAVKVGGPEANDMGVICRYVDESNFYFFTISSDGYYGISKLSGGVESLLGVEQLLHEDTLILPGNATNKIRADCIGSTLSLWTNGSKLFEVEDTDFSSGNVGLIAGSYEEGGVDIRFDNFIVSRP